MFMDEKVTKINEMNLSPDTEVTLSYSCGADCFVHNETEIETALENTDTVSEFAEMVSKRGMNFTDTYGNNVIDELVEKEFLERDFVEQCWAEEDEDGEKEYYDEDLQEVIAEAINDNFYDQESIESEVNRFDYKRGEVYLNATLKTTVGAVLENTPSLAGWEVSVPLQGGTFTL